MLQEETVEKETLQLLNNLQNEPLLGSCRLVGGTSLALQIGHRKSTDLDLFTTERFDFDETFAMLSNKYGLQATRTNPNTIIGFIEGIKIDVIFHPFKWIDRCIEESGLKLASTKDVAAMKIHAIINSGQRPKDFVDIAFLSTKYSYNEMKRMAIQKYPAYNSIMCDKAVNYFGDIDKGLFSQIKMTGEQEFSWSIIEKRLIMMTDRPDYIFHTSPLQVQNKKTRGIHI